jgi:hypothetical protein
VNGVAGSGTGRRAAAGRVAQGRLQEHGSVLLAAMLLLAVSAAMTAALVGRAAAAASELRARRDVLCARYAALGGLALGIVPADASTAAAIVGPRVTSLTVETRLVASDWCVRRAAAACGDAIRTLERTMPDPSACTPP